MIMDARDKGILRNILISQLFLGLSLSAIANDSWPNWRGPNVNGSVTTGTYPVKFSSDNVLWKVALPGKGTSVPAVHAGQIYVTSPAEKEDAVLAFDFTGKQIWQRKLGPAEPPKHQTLASSCNASPVTDGKLLYVYFKSGNFAALNLDGTVRWKQNLVEQFGKDQLFWDQGTSPALTDKTVVIARMHGGESWIAAFDKITGDLRWREIRNFQTPVENNNGYTTPLLFQHQDKPALLVWGADRLTAHHADTGKVLWTCGGFNPDQTGYWPAIATPVISGNIAVIPVGRDDRNQARMHGIRLDGLGDVSSTHRIWQRDDTGVFVATPVEYKGRVYLLRHKGEVVCLDPTNGKTIWVGAFPEYRTPYYSSPVIGNGMLYAAREDGVIFVARIEDRFELLSQNPMNERVIAAPVTVADRLLIRGDRHLFCIATK
jgi:outer membrane protein assembly factor BamB